MPKVTKHANGRPSWADLATSDLEGSKAFYTGLFGWEADDQPIGDGMVYTMMRLDGATAAALYRQGPQEPGPPHWNTYVTVDDLSGSVEKARAAGGSILAEPFDVFESGRMAVTQDPTGAIFSMWQPREHIGAEVLNEPGAMCWNELSTRDVDAARGFYSDVLGWGFRAEQMGDAEYSFIANHGEDVGGMIGMDESRGDTPPRWQVYFAVGDCDEAVAKIVELGGEIVGDLVEAPVGRFAFVSDPQGAMFTIFQRAEES